MATSGPPAGFADAFEKLRESVNPKDAQNFEATTLKDVWAAAKEIESKQRERQSVRNLRRIEPLLKALEKYSKFIEIICNGTPYLPYLWAPIKLMLQLASEFANVFEKLLVAYARIAEALPRFERFEKAFSQDPQFQNVMGMVYAEILEFHRLAYKFFRRRAWHIIFDSFWKDFDSRFNGILESLARHRDLVDKEALSIDIVEAKKWRLQAQENLKLRENERRHTQLQQSTAWLAIEDVIQEDDLDRLSRRRQAGTCEWILKNPKITSWFADTNDVPILWLKGIPGAGKSILSSHIIQSLLRQQKTTVAYYFCNSHKSRLEHCGEILRTIALQILRENQDLAAYVSDNYANYGGSPSIHQLRKLIPELLANVPTTRIVIDGLDECHDKDQQAVLQELLPLCSPSEARCKLLFSSREGASIGKSLRKKPFISLKDKNLEVENDIRHFVHHRLGELRERFGSDVLDNIEQKLVEKAGGMFLWVRLIIATLEDQYSLQDLEDAMNRLPNGLYEAYGRILDHLMKDLSSSSREKALQILRWVACSFRALKVYEILDGVVFERNASISERTKLNRNILDLCKPLIEIGPGEAIEFVHFSAKEYLLHSDSGPFLHTDIAHRNIAISCMTYLASTACFVDPAVSESEIRLRVVKGYHGLDRYAQEYWLDHLLEFGRLQTIMNASPRNDLFERLQRLRQFEKPDLSPEFTAELSCVNVTTTDGERLLMFDCEPEIRKFLNYILVFRGIMDREKQILRNPDDLASHELKFDPTHLTEISQRCQNTIELLLDTTNPNDLIGEELKFITEFRKMYKDLFNCRYRKCQRHVSGFTSRKERAEHELLHLKTFKCMDYMCEFYNSGFRTKKALQKHNSKYHSKQEDIELPIFGQSIPLRPKPVSSVQFIPDITSLLRAKRTHTIKTIDELSRLSSGPHLIGPYQIRTLPCFHNSEKLKYERIVSSLWNITNAGPQHQEYEPSTRALKAITEKLTLDIEKAYQGETIRPLPMFQRENWGLITPNPRVLRTLDVDVISRTGPAALVTDMAFSPNGEFIAICGVSTNIHDVSTGNLIKRLVFKDPDRWSEPATSFSEHQPSLKKQMNLVDYMSRKDDSIWPSPATSSTESQPGPIRQVSLGNHISQRQHGNAENISIEESAKCVSFAPRGHILATGGHGTLRIWNIRDSRVLQARLLQVHANLPGEVNSLEWARETLKLACCAGRSVYVWNYTAEKLTLVHKFNCQKVLLRVALSADAKYVAAGDDSYDCSLIYLWSTSSGQLISQFAGGDGAGNVRSLSFAPKKQYTLTGSWNHFIKVWDLKIGDRGHLNNSNETTLYSNLQHLPRAAFNGFAFTSEGRWLIGSCEDGSMLFFNFKTRSRDAELEITDDQRMVFDVAPIITCSPVRGIFATSGSKGVIRIWVYKHYSPGSSDIAIDASLTDGCDWERTQPFEQVVTHIERIPHDARLYDTLAPLWRSSLIKRFMENKEMIFLIEKYWQLIHHINKDEERTKILIRSYALLTKQFGGDRNSFIDPFTISPPEVNSALVDIRHNLLILSDAIEKHRRKIHLSDIDLSPVNELIGRDVTIAPIKGHFDAFREEEANISRIVNPADGLDALSSDDEHVATFPKEPDQRVLLASESIVISDEDNDEAANPSNKNEQLLNDSIVISSDEDEMEVDFIEERPLKRKRRRRPPWV